MSESKDNYFNAMCHGICEAKQLDAAILVTAKADLDNGVAAIELHGDGPNPKAVGKLKNIIATAIAESIAAFKAEKSKREATNAD